MSRLSPVTSALLLVVVGALPVIKERLLGERNLYLSDHPRSEAPRVYVAGRVATVLRFEQPCDTAQTKLSGWEGRFEPLLVGGRSVLLVPLHDLAPEDRFPLVVTLADGTRVPFTVVTREERVDQQVNVFPDREGPEAMLASLYDALGRERRLEEKVERYEKEENSVDHSLATLLAKKAESLTPFRYDKKWLLKGEEVTLEVQRFTGRGKVALVFQVTNLDPDQPWSLMEARLLTATTGETRPFALRKDRNEIAPGEAGRIAVVVDGAAFSSKEGPEKLVLELFRKDGLQQAYVLLEKPVER